VEVFVSQVIQIVGAVAILAAFAAAQARRVDVASWPYLWLNLAGASVLAASAWHEGQWGFVLLEGAWAGVSAWGLAARWRGRAAASH
jgi:hypothetical protein